MLKITVTIKHAYGRELIVPVCPQAKLFAALAKQTTLTDREIDLIKRLGFRIEVETQAVVL